jgi:hypothetical protein
VDAQQRASEIQREEAHILAKIEEGLFIYLRF